MYTGNRSTDESVEETAVAKSLVVTVKSVVFPEVDMATLFTPESLPLTNFVKTRTDDILFTAYPVSIGYTRLLVPVLMPNFVAGACHLNTASVAPKSVPDEAL